MHHPAKRQNMHRRLTWPHRAKTPLWFTLAVIALVVTMLEPTFAQSATNPSGLPLPRFATTRSQPINVRVGPGTRYEVAWVYVKAGIPIEIIQEFDTWRKIRDFEGEEGWIHQNLLSGRRAGHVNVTGANGQIALRAKPEEQADVRAWLGENYSVEIEQCDGTWCAVRVKSEPEDASSKTYAGFLPQTALWGVYAQETFK